MRATQFHSVWKDYSQQTPEDHLKVTSDSPTARRLGKWSIIVSLSAVRALRCKPSCMLPGWPASSKWGHPALAVQESHRHKAPDSLMISCTEPRWPSRTPRPRMTSGTWVQAPSFRPRVTSRRNWASQPVNKIKGFMVKIWFRTISSLKFGQVTS